MARHRATIRFSDLARSSVVKRAQNLQKVFAYGIRNSFGMTVDPWTGELWESENGGDSFDEINRIEPGHNGGWIQAMGPLARVTQFKEIEAAFRVQRTPASSLAGGQHRRFSHRCACAHGRHSRFPLR